MKKVTAVLHAEKIYQTLHLLHGETKDKDTQFRISIDRLDEETYHSNIEKSADETSKK